MCNGKILDWEDEGGPEFVTSVLWLERYLSAFLKFTLEIKLRKRLMIVRD